jgi:hypothetical protein
MITMPAADPAGVAELRAWVGEQAAIGEPVGGLAWVTPMTGELSGFSQHDPIVVTVGLYAIDRDNAEGRRSITRLGGHTLRLDLTDADDNQRHAVTDRIDHDARLTVGRLERSSSLRLDIRELFGDLPPGDYTLTARYPAGTFDVNINEPLVMPPVRFRLRHVTLKQAEAANRQRLEGQVELSLGEPADPARPGHRLATLNNASDKPIQFAAYGGDWQTPNKIEPGQVYTVLNSMDVFGPDGWRQNMIGWCGTGAASFILPPNTSCQIRLSSSVQSGIVRYSLWLNEDEQVVSRAVLLEPAAGEE